MIIDWIKRQLVNILGRKRNKLKEIGATYQTSTGYDEWCRQCDLEILFEQDEKSNKMWKRIEASMQTDRPEYQHYEVDWVAGTDPCFDYDMSVSLVKLNTNLSQNYALQQFMLSRKELLERKRPEGPLAVERYTRRCGAPYPPGLSKIRKTLFKVLKFYRDCDSEGFYLKTRHIPSWSFGGEIRFSTIYTYDSAPYEVYINSFKPYNYA